MIKIFLITVISSNLTKPFLYIIKKDYTARKILQDNESMASVIAN